MVDISGSEYLSVNVSSFPKRDTHSIRTNNGKHRINFWLIVRVELDRPKVVGSFLRVSLSTSVWIISQVLGSLVRMPLNRRAALSYTHFLRFDEARELPIAAFHFGWHLCDVNSRVRGGGGQGLRRICQAVEMVEVEVREAPARSKSVILKFGLYEIKASSYPEILMVSRVVVAAYLGL